MAAVAVAAAVPVSAAVLPAAWLGIQLHAAAPCETAVAHAAIPAAGTPTTPTISKTASYNQFKVL